MKRIRWQFTLIGLIAVTVVSQIALDVALSQQGKSQQSAMMAAMGGKSPLPAAFERINQLKQKLKKVEEEKRKEVVLSIQNACNEYFDEDMVHRRSVLDRLRKRADDAKALIDKRRSSKEELVDLQLKSFQFEAEGLEFQSIETQDQVGGQPAQTLFSAPLTSKTPPSTTNAAHEGPQDKQQAKERHSAIVRIAKARTMLNAAEGVDAANKATEEMKAALAEYFDLDLASRRQAIESVMEKLKMMESRLEKRANAKASIVELQVKMVVNEADGLGFFSEGESVSVGTAANFNRPLGERQ